MRQLTHTQYTHHHSDGETGRYCQHWEEKTAYLLGGLEAGRCMVQRQDCIPTGVLYFTALRNWDYIHTQPVKLERTSSPLHSGLLFTQSLVVFLFCFFSLENWGALKWSPGCAKLKTPAFSVEVENGAFGKWGCKNGISAHLAIHCACYTVMTKTPKFWNWQGGLGLF